MTNPFITDFDGVCKAAPVASALCKGLVALHGLSAMVAVLAPESAAGERALSILHVGSAPADSRHQVVIQEVVGEHAFRLLHLEPGVLSTRPADFLSWRNPFPVTGAVENAFLIDHLVRTYPDIVIGAVARQITQACGLVGSNDPDLNTRLAYRERIRVAAGFRPSSGH